MDGIHWSKLQTLGTSTIPGEMLETPRPGMLYNILASRYSDELVLQILEMPNGGLPPGDDPWRHMVAELRLDKFAFGRMLDVLRAWATVLDSAPESRARLSNLESILPDDVGKREPFEGA